MAINIKVTAGLDIGNGYIKGAVKTNDSKNVISIDMPSCVGVVPNPIDFPASDLNEEIANIYNQAYVKFDSPIVGGAFGDTRMYFGKRAVASGKSLEVFDIGSNVSKAEQSLSSILVLGTIASAALQGYYNEHKALPEEQLSVSAYVALALPITEFKEYKDFFAKKFMSHTHLVCFHNFEKPVRVEIKFPAVRVLAEGASAQVAIVNKGEPFMNALLADVRKHGIALDGIVAKDVLSAEGTLGIDIGEGTVNNPAFSGRKFNTDFSANINMGYGTVLENSLPALRQNKINDFSDRKALAEFLQKKPSALTRNKYNRVKQIVDNESQALVSVIVKEFTRIMNKSNGQIEVVYVYGGGATPIKDLLYPALINAAKSFAAGGDFPILYLDSSYSRYLNREGLFQLASVMSNQTAGQIQGK